jgi:pimeloyl-ACP methyl ester carboxylesterase
MAVSHDVVHVLPDGRRLGYSLLGRPDGLPVFVFHGTPGSRLPTGDEDLESKKLGLRFVTTDRPGFGLSDYRSGRTLSDWPSDVASLADGLGIRELAVLGFSGGGPHALVCAHQLPDRVRRAVVVNCMPPVATRGGRAGLDATHRLAWWAVAKIPGMSRIVARFQCQSIRRDPRAHVRQLAGHMAVQDQVRLAGISTDRLTAHLVEAFRNGPRGLAHELRMLSRPWGFALADISPEVWVIHGAADRKAPPASARMLAQSMPRARLLMAIDEGHLPGEETLRAALVALADTSSYAHQHAARETVKEDGR